MNLLETGDHDCLNANRKSTEDLIEKMRFTKNRRNRLHVGQKILTTTELQKIKPISLEHRDKASVADNDSEDGSVKGKGLRDYLAQVIGGKSKKNSLPNELTPNSALLNKLQLKSKH